MFINKRALVSRRVLFCLSTPFEFYFMLYYGQIKNYMYKRILLSLLLIVGVFGTTSLTHALPVESVGVTPSQQTLSYATVPVYQNGVQTGTTKAYTGSILVSVTNPQKKSLCVTVPSTVSLGGYTFPVAGRGISGSGQWVGDNQVCGNDNFQVSVSINVKSTTGAALDAGTYSYPVTSNSSGYESLSASLIISRVAYSVTGVTLAQYNANVYDATNCDVSQAQDPYQAGDYRMCRILPVNNRNGSIFVNGGPVGQVGSFITDDPGTTGTWSLYLPNYRATIQGGVFYGGTAYRIYTAARFVNGAWQKSYVTEIAINPVSGQGDFSNVDSINIYTPMSLSYNSFTLTPATQTQTTTLSESYSQSGTISFNVSDRVGVSCGDVNMSAVAKGPLANYVSGIQGNINTSCAPTISFNIKPSYVSNQIVYRCPIDANGVDEEGIPLAGKIVANGSVSCGRVSTMGNKLVYPYADTIPTTHYLKDDIVDSSAIQFDVTGKTYDGYMTIGTSRTVSATVVLKPTAPTKTISIKSGQPSASFSGDSRNQTVTIPVTITATGFSSENEIIAKRSYGEPLNKFLSIVSYFTTNTSSSIVNGATTLTINKSLTIVRNGENPTSDIIGDIRLTAFSTDGTATATPINVKVTIDGPILPPGDLQLLPRLQSMHVAEKDLPKTVFFDVTASTTADCNSISYVNGYLPDITPSWVTPMRGFGGNKCLTRFAVALPPDALSHLNQSNNSLIGVTAGTATINGTTTTGFAGFWVTVDPSIVVPPTTLTAHLDLSKSGAKVNEVINATTTSTGGSDPKTYKINFGDGTGDQPGQFLSHAYAASGSYTVTGTVTDANGVVATDSKGININTVVVSDLKALLSVSPTQVDVGDPVQAALSASGGTGPYSAYKIDFGDGTISNTSSASNSYDSAGTYTVTGTITDTTGATASVSKTISVNYPRIQAGITITSPTPQSRIITPDKVIVAVSASGGRGAGTYRYSIDFGDGSSPMVYSNAGGSVTNIQHTYTAVSSVTNYQIQVTVTDMAGRAQSDSASVTLTAYPPLACTLNMNKSIGLPPFHPTFIVKSKGGTESKYRILMNADGGTKATDEAFVSNPATASTTLSQYVYLSSGSYSPVARVFDLDLIGSGFLVGTKNASTTCATSTTVLSGSGGETTPGL